MSLKYEKHYITIKKTKYKFLNVIFRVLETVYTLGLYT